MAETLLSPGVLARENDQSFITQGPITAGAAIIGPTVKGRVGIPTLVTTYSDYLSKFGGTFTSGGASYSYFTSIAAYNYFNNGGDTLLVTRITPEDFTPATSTQISNNEIAVAGTKATTGDLDYTLYEFSAGYTYRLPYGGVDYKFTSMPAGFLPPDASPQFYFQSGSNLDDSITNLVTKINTSILSIFSGSANIPGLTMKITAGAAGTSYNGVDFSNAVVPIGTYTSLGTLTGGTDPVTAVAFTLETLGEGDIMNNSGSNGVNGLLVSGSANNIRWQVVAPDTASGTFSLLIRQGNDTTSNPTVLETWTNLSLDPYSPNYIESVIGNQTFNVLTDSTTGNTYVQTVGTYTNKSRYVRVSGVNYATPAYLNSNGGVNNNAAGNSYSSSIPLAASGCFEGATGRLYTSTPNMYQNVSDGNIQGLTAGRYTQSINLLSNTDDYKYNVITIPGVNYGQGSTSVSAVNQLISTAQNRGDALAVVDVANYGANIGTVVANASTLNNSYAATYWPWIQTLDPDAGKIVWVPASTLIPSVYAFTDNVSEPWFAPAGINRGGLAAAIQAERKLSQSDRDTLYVGNVNPIATFPGTGVVVYGQKTLQKQASALDRVNVRRLLIAVKSYISQIANNLVFEQNTMATRDAFLAQVNPYLQSVQQRQGLYAFKVVMDDTNNTADVIDRNQLVGQIYLQPTKTAEFILLDFNVLPTGATFPA
jgi:hypothetical protein